MLTKHCSPSAADPISISKHFRERGQRVPTHQGNKHREILYG
jgi:hypothetical protein